MARSDTHLHRYTHADLTVRDRAYLQRNGGHFIVAEKLRNASGEAKEALARPGRYARVAGNLEAKEVVVGHGEGRQRFVLCHNPEAAERDQRVRDNLVDYLTTQIAGTDEWTKSRRDELAGKLKTTPALWRLTPTDLALAYKQLLEVERGGRDTKSSLGLRPAFHHREDRIRSHVQLCWLALLLIRVGENGTGDTWRNVRHELKRMHVVTIETAEGRVAQRTTTTAGQANILRSLDVAEPGRFFDFELPT